MRLIFWYTTAMLDNIFLQISILLALTVTIAFFMRLLRQPLMIAYLVAGIVAGPFFLNKFHGNAELFDALAQFGVVLLLFMVGLSLNFDHIKRIGKTSLVVGAVQIFFTATIGFLALTLLGFQATSAGYLAAALTFSSTIIIVKLLADKKDTETVYGRYTLGLMVVQDIVALLIIIVLTSIGEQSTLGSVALQLVFKIISLVAFVYFLARFLVPKIMDRVAGSSEFLFIFTVAWCFGVASLLYWLGFSLEVGALIAGLTLGSSRYQTAISSRIRPLRDFFIIIFFIILGSELTLAGAQIVLVPALLLSTFILFGDPFILYHSFRIFRFTRRNSFLAGITAAHVSEFGFVLLFTGKQLGHINGLELEVFTLVALITIVLSSYAITYNESLYSKLKPFFNLFGKDKHQQREDEIEKYDVWVFGYHRIGWKICEALAEKKISFAVVDFNPVFIEKLQRRGIPAFFGDVADVEFLANLPLDKAKLVVSTLPEVDDQLTLIKYVRSQSEKIFIISNLYYIDNVPDFYAAGANYVMLPHLLGGHFMAEILKGKPWTRRTFEKLKIDQQKEMKLRFTSGTR